MINKAQYLQGTPRRKSDRHKREGDCAIPGEILMVALVLLASRGVGISIRKSAEAIVGALALKV